MKDVLIVLSEDMVGGTETNLMRVVTHPRSAGIRYAICFLSEPGSLTGEFAKANIRTYHLNYRKGNWWEVIRNLYRILRSSSFDFIYPFGFRISFLTRIINLIAGNTKVIGSHRNVTIRQNTFIDFFERITSPLVTAYVANSWAGYMQLAGLGIPRSKLFTIHNGIDASAWQKNSRDAARNSLQIPADALVITCVANFKIQKGHRYLIGACEILQKKYHNLLFLFVGGCIFEPETEKQIKSQIHSSGLDHVIKLLGIRDDVPAILDASDIFVLPSLWEGLPNAILEAMAKSLPVVATDVGGGSEVVLDDVTGFLVPPGDAQALAISLGKLIDDAVLRDRFGSAGRKQLEEMYNLETEVYQMNELFSNL